MNKFQGWRIGWWRSCLAGTAAVTLMAGCASMKPGGSPLARKIDETKPVQTASYQEASIDEGPPKKVSDPIGLKLRYAEWMEEIENFNEAQTQYNVVLRERPKNIDAILGLARIDQAAGRKAQAEAGFKKAISLQAQSPVAKNALGQFYGSEKRWPEALPLLRDAMMSDSTNKTYRHHLAVALAMSGDPSAAFPHFVQSVGDVAAHYNVGMILKKQGQYRQAEQQFLQALTKNPNFEPAKQAITEVRQQAQAASTYASQQHSNPQIQPAGHQTGYSLTPAQQEQLRNQRPLSR